MIDESEMPVIKYSNVAAVLLSGGLSRRMGGGHKPLLPLAGKPILQHIIDCIGPQLGPMVINANGSIDLFSQFDLPITGDSFDGFVGPLAGILAGMDWVAENAPECRYMVSISGDSPFLPHNLVEKLISPLLDGVGQLSVASSLGRTQPVIGAWDILLREDLRKAIGQEDIRKVDRWTSRFNVIEVSFSATPYDPFFNTNRPEDLESAERIYKDYYKS